MNNMNQSLPQQHFQIVDYTREAPEWKSYIRPNAEKILNFMKNGYLEAGKGDFLGIPRAESVYRSCSMVRIAFCGKEWVAIALYSSYQGGFKSVGVTATTNHLYREIGKQAVNAIIKKNVADYKLFFWTVCSDVIEHLYERNNGISIPSEFAELYVPDYYKGVIDEYHFKYQNSKMEEPLSKAIFGFNSEETFNAVYSKYTKHIDDSIKTVEKNQQILYESIVDDTPTYQLILQANKLTILVDLELEGVHELPVEKLVEFKSYIDKMEDLFKDVSLKPERIAHYKSMLEVAKYSYDMMQPMVLHKFEN